MVHDYLALTRELALPVPEQLVAVRRDLHRFAEPGWCEVRTACKVTQVLSALGWTVRLGSDVIDTKARLGVPSQDTLDFFFRKAIETGADPATAEKLRDGLTGVVGILRSQRPGPVVAFRFDMDANSGVESGSAHHAPVRNGFASIHAGIHHNCGHDGHTSLGLALARVLAMKRDELVGEIRLIFQPAEEGLRGARAMVAAGALDGVDYFVGCHLGVQALKLGEIIAGYDNILGSVKLDIEFTGVSAHAAISPHVGRNALMAACVAAQNLMALPRHGAGDTRINVGFISGGESRNAVPATARLSIELRADRTAALEYLKEAADRVISGAAIMHDVRWDARPVGESCAASSDVELAQLVAAAARKIPEVTDVRDRADFKASDDAAEMMRTVQSQGGKAVYFGVGTPLNAVHHNPLFDFDERALGIGLKTLTRVAQALEARQ
jgi:aminobenzoyl-glutamate utilization protein A